MKKKEIIIEKAMHSNNSNTGLKDENIIKDFDKKEYIILGPSRIVELVYNGNLSLEYIEGLITKNKKNFSLNNICYLLTSDLISNYSLYLPENNDVYKKDIELFLEKLKKNREYYTEDDLIKKLSGLNDIQNSIEILENIISGIMYNNGTKIIKGEEIIKRIGNAFKNKETIILFEYVLILFNFICSQSIFVLENINKELWDILKTYNYRGIIQHNIFEKENKNKKKSGKSKENKGKKIITTPLLLEETFLSCLVDYSIHKKTFKSTEIKGYFNYDRLMINYDYKKVFITFILQLGGDHIHIFDRFQPDEMLFINFLEDLFKAIINKTIYEKWNEGIKDFQNFFSYFEKRTINKTNEYNI